MSSLRIIKSFKLIGLFILGLCGLPVSATNIDDRLTADNKDQGTVNIVNATPLNDLAYLRKVTIDVVGRVPTVEEIQQYENWPKADRRDLLLDKLFKDDGFADRWTIFFSDILRVRSEAEGGNRLLAYVHQSIDNKKPWDKMARELIAASGSSGDTPSVGFLLSDDSDPMTMAGARLIVGVGFREHGK